MVAAHPALKERHDAVTTGDGVAKSLTMGADAVAIGQGVLFALGYNSQTYVQKGQALSAVDDYHKLGTVAGRCHLLPHGQVPGRRDDAGRDPGEPPRT